MSPFGAILRAAVETTPGALGGAFAAWDGEMVDSFATVETETWAVLTAHYGVVFAQVQAALSTLHYGGAELVLIEHGELAVLIQAVADGYFALLAVGAPRPLGAAMHALRDAAAALRQEMA